MTLTFTEVTELKEEINRRFSSQIHFHDGCGGQFFTLDEKNDELEKFIIAYFTERNLRAKFSEDGLHFTVKNNKV